MTFVNHTNNSKNQNVQPFTMRKNVFQMNKDFYNSPSEFMDTGDMSNFDDTRLAQLLKSHDSGKEGSGKGMPTRLLLEQLQQTNNLDVIQRTERASSGYGNLKSGIPHGMHDISAPNMLVSPLQDI